MKLFQFSKLIIMFETVLVGLVSWRTLDYVELCIMQGYDGGLAFLTTIIGAAYGAYGVSVSYYYNKAKAENITKISGASVDAMAQATSEQGSMRGDVRVVHASVDADPL